MSTATHAYCIRCRREQPLDHARTHQMANGKPSTSGQCAVCGTGVYRLGTKPARLTLPDVPRLPRHDVYAAFRDVPAARCDHCGGNLVPDGYDVSCLQCGRSGPTRFEGRFNNGEYLEA